MSNFCSYCGKKMTNNNVCTKCDTTDSIKVETKDRTVAVILAFFLGGFGIHKFYLNQPLWGLTYILFCWTGIPAIVAFIEGIIYIATSEEEFQNKYVK